MKRSDAVKYLKQYLPIESGLCNDRDASDLLQAIEDLGMLPPNSNEWDMAVKNPKTGEWLITYETIVREHTKPVYKWESEDET